jgi:CDP-glucose 4,6-dehydratase
MYLNIYKGKKVLVTGHTGFKGSWLCLVLKILGAKVYGYSLKPKESYSNFYLNKLNKNMNNSYADIRDYNKLEKYISTVKPDVVFHLAAQALVKDSYIDPITTFSTNIMGTANILNIIKDKRFIRAFVCITSDKCYENKEWIYGYRENDQLGGIDPYSASKASAEIIFASFLRSVLDLSNRGYATARAGNIIGGGDWSDNRIVPDAIKSIIKKKTLFLRNPHSTRPWEHVLEPINGYLKLGYNLLIKPQEFTGSWNFGPSNEKRKTVKELIESLFKILKKGKVKMHSKKEAFYESKELQLNCDKSNKYLDWKTNWNFEKTVLKTAEWYQSFDNNEDMLEVSTRQIKEFLYD